MTDSSPPLSSSTQKVEGYFQNHCIESIFDELRLELSEHMPRNPLLFLRNILIHKEAEHQYKKIRHQNRRVMLARHQPVVLDVSRIESSIFEPSLSHKKDVNDDLDGTKDSKTMATEIAGKSTLPKLSDADNSAILSSSPSAKMKTKLDNVV